MRTGPINLPKVAVLLATFNGADHISQQLASLFSQLDVDVHVIVRDDGSSDATLEKLSVCAEQYPDQLSIVCSDGVEGSSAGLNFIALLKMVVVADYDYFALCDQDDVWAPDKLRAAIRKMDDTQSSGYSSNLIAFDNGKMKSWIVNKSSEQRKFDYLFQSASAGCTYVLDRSAVTHVQKAFANPIGTLPRSLSHDYVVYAICRSAGLRWYMDYEAYIFYRQHMSNVFSALPGVGGLWARFKLTKSGWYRENIGVVSKLVKSDTDSNAIFKRFDRFTFMDRLWLAMNCSNFRRRRRDQALLAVIIFLGLI